MTLARASRTAPRGNHTSVFVVPDDVASNIGVLARGTVRSSFESGKVTKPGPSLSSDGWTETPLLIRGRAANLGLWHVDGNRPG
jgi:hypothetical protein